MEAVATHLIALAAIKQWPSSRLQLLYSLGVYIYL